MDHAESGGRHFGLLVKSVVWIVVVLITLAVADYQRSTGPTYPISIDTQVGDAKVVGKLPRTHPGVGGPTIALKAVDPNVGATVLWRRHHVQEGLRRVPMTRRGNELAATLPHFPPAAKVAYTVELTKAGQSVTVPEQPAVLRYRGDVPAPVLIAHILLMFLGLLFGVRITVAALMNEPGLNFWFKWLVPSLLLGGFVLGPMMSWYSFGEIWTGWPLGADLTDSKTLGTTLLWLAAWIVAVRRPRWGRVGVVLAAIAMFAAYLIPHSLAGSELNWSDSAPTAGRGPGR